MATEYKDNGDFRFATSFIRSNLNMSGTCPRMSSDGCLFMARKLAMIVFYVSTMSLCVGTIISAITYDHLDNEWVFINLLFIGFVLICMTVQFVILIQGNKINKCLEFIQKDWEAASKEDRVIMFEFYKLGYEFTKECNIFIFVCTVFWHAIPLLKKPIIIDGESYQNFAHSNKYFLFNPNVFPYVIIVRIHQFVSSFMTGVLMANMCCIISAFVMHNCGQYEVLITRVKNMTKKPVSELTQKDWAYAIKRHIHAMKFTEQIEITASPIVLLEMLRCIDAVCMCLFLFLWDKSTGIFVSIMRFFAISAATYCAYIFCLVGEKLIKKSDDLKVAVYDCDWYNMQRSKFRLVLTMLFLCNHPKELTASGFSTLSFCTFGNVLKTTFGFLNMFRTIS